MPVDLQKLKQEMANAPEPRSDFRFAEYDKLRLNYGTQAHPTPHRVKLFSWPPEGGVVAQRVLSHFGLGASGRGSVICPKQHGDDQPCPLCDIVRDVSQSGDETQRKTVVKFAQKERFWFFCANVDEIARAQGAIEKIYVWDAASTAYYQIIALMQQEWGDFTALPESPCISIQAYRDGQSPGGKYNIGGSPSKIRIDLAGIRHLFPDPKLILAAPPPAMLEAMLRKSPTGGAFAPPRRTAGGQQASRAAPTAAAGAIIEEEGDNIEMGGPPASTPAPATTPAPVVARGAVLSTGGPATVVQPPTAAATTAPAAGTPPAAPTGSTAMRPRRPLSAVLR